MIKADTHSLPLLAITTNQSIRAPVRSQKGGKPLSQYLDWARTQSFESDTNELDDS